MTVTISRLDDNYADAQRAVQRLEAAGGSHLDISIVANNSDNWFSADEKVDHDRRPSPARGPAVPPTPAPMPAPVPAPSARSSTPSRSAIARLEPVVAAGWSAATAVGAAAGAATGGMPSAFAGS